MCKRCGIIIVLTACFAIAEGPDTLWTKTYGDSGQYWDIGLSVQQTADSGYIVAGITDWYLCRYYGDVYLLRTNSMGDTLWTKKYGGDSTDKGFSVQQTSDGGYVVAANTKSYGAGNGDAWLIKTNSSGDATWTRTYGGIGSDGGRSVVQTSDGGYIVTGYTESFGSGNSDVWLLRTDSLGDTIWAKAYGGIETDVGYCVQQTADGGYIIAGYTESYGAGNGDAWLIKTNSFGDTLWTKTYGGTQEDVCMSVQQTSDGGYVATGWTSSFSVDTPDVYLIRTTGNGDTTWTRTYGVRGRDLGKSVQLTPDGAYIVAGWKGSGDAYLIKVNSRGDTIWTKAYGGADFEVAHAVDLTADGGYVLAGCRYRGSGDDVWLMKTAPDTLGIEEGPHSRLRCLSFEVFPNPVRRACMIRYALSRWAQVNVSLFDVTGRVVAAITNENQSAGTHSRVLNMTGLPQGIYFIRLGAGDYAETKKIVVTE